MPRLVLYAAQSLDGYIADPDGGIDWLTQFDSPEYGFQRFLAGIAVVVMGRTTYGQVRGFAEWPYPGKTTVVLTSRPLGAGAPEGVVARSGDPAALLEELRRDAAGDIWHAGGGIALRPFLDAGMVDRLELWIIPVLLGRGIPLFPPPGPTTHWRLDGTATFPNGVVNLNYERAA